MPVTLAVARGSIQALAGKTANDFVSSIVGHAFSDHMSKAAAAVAAVAENRDKGYYERITTVRVNTADDFVALSPKEKSKALPNTSLWQGKKRSQFSKHITGKDLTFQATRSLDVSGMAFLIHQAVLLIDDAEFRHGGVEGRFLYFTRVPQGFVARAMTPAGAKQGGGGIDNPGLPCSVLVVAPGVGANVVVISAYPSGDAYRLGRLPVLN